MAFSRNPTNHNRLNMYMWNIILIEKILKTKSYLKYCPMQYKERTFKKNNYRRFGSFRIFPSLHKKDITSFMDGQ
jgi:hypothetical protein